MRIAKVARVFNVTVVSLFAAVFIACSGGTTPEVPHSAPALRTSEIETPIPPDVTYEIIRENTDEVFDKTREKRSVDVRLNRTVSRDVLRAIALTIKKSDPNTYERTFISYFLPGMENADRGCWATTHFNPDLEVVIVDNYETADEAKASHERINAFAKRPSEPSEQMKGAAESKYSHAKRQFEPSGATGKPALRNWTDSTGHYQLEASFAGMISGTVKLRKGDGTVIKLQFDQLSDEDQEWIRNRSKAK